MDQRRGDATLQLDHGGEVFTDDHAHALGRGERIRAERGALRSGQTPHTLAMAAELHEVVDQMAADVHQAVAAVIPLAIPLDVMGRGRCGLVEHFQQGAHHHSLAVLVVHRDPDAAALARARIASACARSTQCELLDDNSPRDRAPASPAGNGIQPG